MRSLPDPDLSLRDASDFIFDSGLGRRALSHPNPPGLAVFLREIIQSIYRLTISCHLPEFTDHGLGHLCSLVDRLSNWTPIGAAPSHLRVVDGLDADQASILLLATLFHDIGMLSQRPEDLPPGEEGTRSLEDIPGWVRGTHVSRMERLIHRLFRGTEFEPLLGHALIVRALSVARAHGSWPWDWVSFAFPANDAGLAAMLAVADLLDEDALRCDSATLLRHRYGNAVNCAHWIRHGLTLNRVLITNGQVDITLARPPGTDANFAPIFSALRNHYRLILLYTSELGQVGASLLSVNFTPGSGLPIIETPALAGWTDMPEFRYQSALIFHLLESFMPEALLDSRRLAPAQLANLHPLALNPIDLSEFYRIRGSLAPRTPIEQSFHAILGH